MHPPARTSLPPPAHAAYLLRYFLTYRGMRLPLQLTEELPADALANRNTFFRAGYDEAGRLCWIEKLVYGAVEMRHDYAWGADGELDAVTVQVDGEDPQTQVLRR